MIVKYLEMKGGYPTGPKCNDMFPYKREAEGDVTHTQEKEMRKQKQRTGMTPPQGKEWVGQGKDCSLLEPPEGAQPCQHLAPSPVVLISDGWPSEL